MFGASGKCPERLSDVLGSVEDPSWQEQNKVDGDEIGYIFMDPARFQHVVAWLVGYFLEEPCAK